MDVAVTGSSGLIGTALRGALTGAGHRVLQVVRRAPSGTGEIGWDPAAGTIDAAGLEGVDAVVHLAGAGIGDRRWTDERKRVIVESRTTSTSLLATTMATLQRPPAVLLSGSAIGFYGERGDEELTEASPPGAGFLSELVVAWEAAAAPAADAGIRTCFLRTGIVQSTDGGALKKALTPFKLGLGGRFGSGRQWWPWISIDDEVGAILHLLRAAGVAGPVNLTAPNPVTNAEYTKALGRALHRPTTVIPMIGPKLLLGSELAENLLTMSQRVLPTVLPSSGYRFRHETLEACLGALLGPDERAS